MHRVGEFEISRVAESEGRSSRPSCPIPVVDPPDSPGRVSWIPMLTFPA
jgi:hypothetical protein